MSKAITTKHGHLSLGLHSIDRSTTLDQPGLHSKQRNTDMNRTVDGTKTGTSMICVTCRRHCRPSLSCAVLLHPKRPCFQVQAAGTGHNLNSRTDKKKIVDKSKVLTSAFHHEWRHPRQKLRATTPVCYSLSPPPLPQCRQANLSVRNKLKQNISLSFYINQHLHRFQGW